jgi:hypothetical protein
VIVRFVDIGGVVNRSFSCLGSTTSRKSVYRAPALEKHMTCEMKIQYAGVAGILLLMNGKLTI